MITVTINKEQHNFTASECFYGIRLSTLRERFNLINGDFYLIRDGKRFYLDPGYGIVYFKPFDTLIVENRDDGF
jgi:hypothetical protein